MNMPQVKSSSFKKEEYWKPALISAVVFPLLVIIFDNLITTFIPEYSFLSVLKVSEQAKVLFYINFYGWFILSGSVISIFYQVTDYCKKDDKSWVKFAMKYSLLLWTPVVMIMVLFGTDFMATSIASVIFIICITILSWINSFLLKNYN